MRVLAGDIGGTHARLAIVEVDATARIVAEQTVRSQQVEAFTPLLARFIAGAGAPPARACLGFAGPVADGRVSGTNLPWTVSERELSASLRIPLVRLINDFEAVGYGLSRLAEADFMVLQAGAADPEGTRGLLGAGTGLGEGFLVRSGEGYSVQPSEGGHATFTVESERQWGLFRFLRGRYGHVSAERVISGPGLVDLFEFVGGLESGLGAELAREDPAAVITRHALAGSNARAVEALELFVAAYGAAAGNLALTVLATGGIYLAGGIARHIAPKLAEGGFMAAFLRKGRLQTLLERIPVRVILNPDVGLLGAATVAAGA
jgi:glucokinase